jgi:sRNA-binding protein
MSSAHRIERGQGTRQSRQHFAALRQQWPLAFPIKPEDVRPLAVGAAGEIAAAMGWSLPYTLGVLGPWKMAPAYCEAVLCYDRRIALDGTPAEEVGAKARELAARQLARVAARTAAKTDAAHPRVMKPPATRGSIGDPGATGGPELRVRVRASLLRRRA